MSPSHPEGRWLQLDTRQLMKDLLMNAPCSYTYLAERVGVSVQTVYKWTREGSNSYRYTLAVMEVIKEILNETQEVVDRAEEMLRVKEGVAA